MIGLMVSVIIFNFIAIKTNKRLSLLQVIHIWTFTIAFQMLFDFIVEFKYHGYWYFSKNVDWIGLIPRTVLIPPVNVIFLNWYPFEKKASSRIGYVVLFVIAIILYELAALLPEPWGYFHYGWWEIGHSIIVDPIILFVLLGFYKWIVWIEEKSGHKKLADNE